MKTTLIALLSLLGMSTATSAQNQPLEGPLETIPAAGFNYGKSSGLTPQTDNENFDCAVFWDVWHSAYVGNLIPQNIELKLPSDLSRGVTSTTRDEWRQVVAKSQNTTPILALIKIIEKTPDRKMAQNQVIEGLKGDKGKLFRISNSLGTCVTPPRLGS